MRTFERRLAEALLGYDTSGVTAHPTGDSSPGFRKYKAGEGAWNTVDPYKAPKLYELLSKQLSKHTKHNLIIMAGSNLGPYAGGPADGAAVAALSKISGITPETFQRAITLLIVGDQNQRQVTPWLILHQLGEAIAQAGTDPWEVVSERYKKYFKEMPPVDPDVSADAEIYGEDAAWQEVAFHHLFRMRSAREFLHGGFDNIDPGQEIIVEYLWHGGRIRMNTPPWLPPRVVSAINTDLTTLIDRLLNDLVGHRIPNMVANSG